VGVVLVAITTAFTTISSFLFGQAFRRPGQFGNFTGAPQLGNMNPFAILAVIIAVVGVLWLGLSLRKSSLESHERENASTGGKPETE